MLSTWWAGQAALTQVKILTIATVAYSNCSLDTWCKNLNHKNEVHNQNKAKQNNNEMNGPLNCPYSSSSVG